MTPSPILTAVALLFAYGGSLLEIEYHSEFRVPEGIKDIFQIVAWTAAIITSFVAMLRKKKNDE
jgi:hypothetical protein